MVYFKILLLLFAVNLSYTSSGESTYISFIAAEQKIEAEQNSNDLIAGGLAAIGVGLYGHYNTDANILMKLVYSATETAGVYTVASAVRLGNSRRLTLDLHKALEESDKSGTNKIETEEIRRIIAQNHQRNQAAELRTNAYSASLLSTLYFYHAYRERSADNLLVNIYCFLGANFALGAIYSFYKLNNNQNDKTSISFSPLPTPTIAWIF